VWEHFWPVQRCVEQPVMRDILRHAVMERFPQLQGAAGSAVVEQHRQHWEKLMDTGSVMTYRDSWLAVGDLAMGPAGLLATAHASSRQDLTSEKFQRVSGMVRDYLQAKCGSSSLPKQQHADGQVQQQQQQGKASDTDSLEELSQRDDTAAAQLLLQGPVPVGAMMPQEAWCEHQQQLLGAAPCEGCHSVITSGQVRSCWPFALLHCHNPRGGTATRCAVTLCHTTVCGLLVRGKHLPPTHASCSPPPDW